MQFNQFYTFAILPSSSAVKCIETLLRTKSNYFRVVIVLTYDLLEDSRREDLIHLKCQNLSDRHTLLSPRVPLLLLP